METTVEESDAIVLRKLARQGAFTGALAITGNFTLTGDLTVTGTTAFTGAVGVTGALTSTGKISSENLVTEKVEVTAAEVKALAASPKTLIAAQGENTIIEFVSAMLHLTPGSEALAENGGGSNLQIRYTDGSGVLVSEAIEMTGYITEAASPIATSARPKADQIDMAANAALVLDNVGAGEITGNATEDAVLNVFITYRVHDVS